MSYFEDKQRGWFWYEVLPEPVKKSQPETQAEQEKPKPDSKTPSDVQAEIEPNDHEKKLHHPGK